MLTYYVADTHDSQLRIITLQFKSQSRTAEQVENKRRGGGYKEIQGEGEFEERKKGGKQTGRGDPSFSAF